ncbi:MAG: sulfatase-like hydrolase/transferase, partial [Planctomycetales bacterium]
MRWILTLALTLIASLASSSRLAAQEKPNFVVIFCDDLGYGAIGSYGATKQKTPALDQMAKEGIRL